jgi:uncharacterized protein YndB with AHSA1/START domain
MPKVNEPLTRDVVITRIINAPRTLVFKAWTDPAMVMKWWGPEGFTSPACKIDFRVGGSYLFCMRSPEGQDIWSTGIYREIVINERIVYTDSFADEKGNVVSGSYYGMDGLPEKFTITLLFEDRGSQTKFTLRHQGLPDGPMIEMTEAGWTSSLIRLEESIAKK